MVESILVFFGLRERSCLSSIERIAKKQNCCLFIGIPLTDKDRNQQFSLANANDVYMLLF